LPAVGDGGLTEDELAEQVQARTVDAAALETLGGLARA